MRNIKITGIGKYIPPHSVTSGEIDRQLGLPDGWAQKKSGVAVRHHAKEESASEMGAKAIQAALTHAGLTVDDLDCIVSASGTMQQPIPCTASLIHEQLGCRSPIPAFDVNSTCLSFVTGLDVMSHLLQAGTYRRVALVASDIASVGINPNKQESYVLFGDAAAACIIEQAAEGETSKIIASKMVTYSEGAHLTEIRGGGTRLHPNHHKVEEDFMFDMNGREVFRMSSRFIKGFVGDLLTPTGLAIQDLDYVIPHQASGMALRIMQGKLGVAEDRFVNIISRYGNTIASSIPLALHELIHRGDLQRGQTIMLLGTSAGLSIGGIVLEY